MSIEAVLATQIGGIVRLPARLRNAPRGSRSQQARCDTAQPRLPGRTPHGMSGRRSSTSQVNESDRLGRAQRERVIQRPQKDSRCNPVDHRQLCITAEPRPSLLRQSRVGLRADARPRRSEPMRYKPHGVGNRTINDVRAVLVSCLTLRRLIFRVQSRWA
jgi:hypothetical protein